MKRSEKRNRLVQWRHVGLSLLFYSLTLAWPAIGRTTALHIGTISNEPAAEIKKFLPLANYLTAELKPDGVEQVKTVVTRTITEMAGLLKTGKADIYIDSPFPTIAASRVAGSRILLRRWKNGEADYYSVIFTRKDSDIELLKNLVGKIVCFKDEDSSSGYLLPKILFADKGLKLTYKSNLAESVAPKEIGYVFSRDERNTMEWVLRGRVPAGAIDYQRYVKEARDRVNDLKIVAQSFSVPRHLVSYRADLSPLLVTRIKEILLRMDQSTDGKKALADFEKTSRFDEVPNESLAPLMKHRGLIEDELGLK
ncbi:MAG: phosphate/phosphite/phosphonate ABC transporter substrate-binding protein [Deltaproteobacteria bacterium]|nr:phosphate/phosphite/phosphonate ABC transporter substrate-binding protein [Deltaproteobacteria bacterium]MDZ4344786.1 phosphate/phosphite/phosphonate ABC transporter substrate-binding protein [Candidatus Binatia bacterium]